MPTFDHHVHTARHSPDSAIDPYVLLERVRQAGLSGVVITEHDHQWAPDELAELASHAPDLVVLSGVEVSAREGHFLVYGLPDLGEVGPGIRLRDLANVVARHEAALVAAHPFRWGQDFDRIYDEHGAIFDAFELVSNNVTPDTRAKTLSLITRDGQAAATGSSDGHEHGVIGCYHSEILDPVTSMADFVRAIRNRRVRPRYLPGAPQAAGPVD